MNNQQYRKGENRDKETEDESGRSVSQMPILASARTGLVGKDDAIVRRMPSEYANKSVGETIDYLVKGKLDGSESQLAESVKKELNSPSRVVVVNGKKVEQLNSKMGDYLVKQEHKLPDGSKKEYLSLEIEISSVQQGGLASKLI